MRTTSKKSSSKVRAASMRKKGKVAVQRVASAVTRHMAKPRAGFEALVEPFAALVEKFGPALGPGLDVELMRSALEAYQSLAADRQAAVEQLASVDSTMLFQSATAWKQILVIYDRARSVARINDDLQADLEPLEQFFRLGPRKSPATAPAPVAVTATNP